MFAGHRFYEVLAFSPHFLCHPSGLPGKGKASLALNRCFLHVALWYPTEAAGEKSSGSLPTPLASFHHPRGSVLVNSEVAQLVLAAFLGFPVVLSCLNNALGVTARLPGVVRDRWESIHGFRVKNPRVRAGNNTKTS